MTRYRCNQCTWRLINSPRGARKKKKKWCVIRLAR